MKKTIFCLKQKFSKLSVLKNGHFQFCPQSNITLVTPPTVRLTGKSVTYRLTFLRNFFHTFTSLLWGEIINYILGFSLLIENFPCCVIYARTEVLIEVSATISFVIVCTLWSCFAMSYRLSLMWGWSGGASIGKIKNYFYKSILTLENYD